MKDKKIVPYPYHAKDIRYLGTCNKHSNKKFINSVLFYHNRITVINNKGFQVGFEVSPYDTFNPYEIFFRDFKEYLKSRYYI